jgi:hypothetical protein
MTLMLLGLAGCTLGPDYSRPQIASPADWRRPPVLSNSDAVADAANTSEGISLAIRRSTNSSARRLPATSTSASLLPGSIS